MDSVKGSEITFNINKYKQTALLDDKESLVQIILNALLMVPGNLPSQPKKGVNIFQYIYSTMDSDTMSDNMITDLRNTVGSDIDASIDNLTVDLIDLDGEGPMFLLIIHLVNNGDEETLALAIKKVNESVKFNYSFLTEAIKNMN